MTTRTSNIKPAVESWVESQSRFRKFTTRDIYDDIYGTIETGSKPNSFYKQINLILQGMVKGLHLCQLREKSGTEIVFSKSPFDKHNPYSSSPVEIPITKQPPLWDVMNAICGCGEKPEFTYADHFKGINIWCEIVVNIWSARNAMNSGPSMPSSLSSSNTILYSAVRGGVSGNAA